MFCDTLTLCVVAAVARDGDEINVQTLEELQIISDWIPVASLKVQKKSEIFKFSAYTVASIRQWAEKSIIKKWMWKWKMREGERKADSSWKIISLR